MRRLSPETGVVSRLLARPLLPARRARPIVYDREIVIAICRRLLRGGSRRSAQTDKS
jgi:hypothetical protein